MKNLQPSILWKHFFMICSIPHVSKKEQILSMAIQTFAKEHGVECCFDSVGNIIMRKPASKGMEKRKTVVLQAHIDMVPQKNSDSPHNFDTDPIVPRIEGEWLKATGTTLGADNGIGVAAILAILEAKDIAHGPIEALLTIDEETGLTGANGLESDVLKGSVLLNLDTEEMSELCIGCAGGINVTGSKKNVPAKVPIDAKSYKISIRGLLGGHSGSDIHLGRGNSNKIMARLLWPLCREHDVLISTFNGGNLRNALPREAFVSLVLPNKSSDFFMNEIRSFETIIKNEIGKIEPDFHIQLEECEMPTNVLDKDTCQDLLNVIYALPHGVIRKIQDMPSVVETSNNLGIVKTTSDSIEIHNLARSSQDTAKEAIRNRITAVFDLAGYQTRYSGSYPGWQPNFNSQLVKTMQQTHKKLFNKDAVVRVVHAGLECGIIGSKYPNMEMISFGPTIAHPHSPDEKVHIQSVLEFWEYLVAALKEI